MQMSRRAKRMEQHHKRHGHGTLNLVSLMDIFTILVFFLLVNASEVEVLPTAKDISLPQSIIDTRATETAVIVVTDTEIRLDENSIVKLAELDSSNQPIAALVTALQNTRELAAAEGSTENASNADNRLPADSAKQDEKPSVTLMADKGTPFTLLKRIMRSSSEAGYSKLSLAVVNHAVNEESFSAATGQGLTQ